MPIALATCLRLPEPDPDQPLLLAALRAAGAEVEMVAWDDPAADPARFDLCVLRSTWNYYEHLDAFTAWLTRAAGATRLANPLEVVRWNLHKGYLLELESQAGLPIVPTRIVRRGEAQAENSTESALAMVRATGWFDVIIKPAISAGSWRTRRFVLGEPESSSRSASAPEFLAGLTADGDALIQPYLRSVESGGERSLVWIDGHWSHAVTKRPRLADSDEHVLPDGPATAAETGLGDRALAAAACAAAVSVGDLLYARLDLIRGDDGAPCISELELIEPSLFLADHPAALDRFVQAILARAGLRSHGG